MTSGKTTTLKIDWITSQGHNRKRIYIKSEVSLNYSGSPTNLLFKFYLNPMGYALVLVFLYSIASTGETALGIHLIEAQEERCSPLI